MKQLLIIFLLCMAISVHAAKPKTVYVRITTSKGESIVKLYNETPQHRDNFVKLIKKGVYNGTLFHRVIKEFMIQGGDPTSVNAKPGVLLGNGDLGYTIPAEFHPELFHKRGALAAARNNNPQKASNASQFYLVQGKVFTPDELNRIEQMNSERKFSEIQRKVYTTLGGTPHLDQTYTVFGEIVRGIEQVDRIADVGTDGMSRPIEDVSMKMELLKKREVRKLEKELIRETFKEKRIMQPRQ